MLIIRKITESDNKILASIIRQAFTELKAPTANTVYEDPTTYDLFKLFKAKGSACWVYEDEGQVFGCCGIYPTADLPYGCVELVEFYLSENARGKALVAH